MAKPAEMMREERKAAIQTSDAQQTAQQEIRERLTALQAYDLSPGGGGQTVEQQRRANAERLVAQDQEENSALIRAQFEGNLMHMQSSAAASGEPVQEQAPAKQTYKEKKEDKRRVAAAKKAVPTCPAADEKTYNMVEALRERSAAMQNSITSEDVARATASERATGKRIDPRVMHAGVQGYRKNKKGLPATPEDARKMTEDRVFLEDWLSADVTRRAPHLDKLTDELLKWKVTPNMLVEPYIHRHMAELRTMTEKMLLYNNIQTDPINAPYFDTLPQLTKDLIESRIFGMDQLHAVLINYAARKGVDFNKNDYYKSDVPPEVYDSFADMESMARPLLADQLTASAQASKDAVRREVTARAQVAKAEQLADNAEQRTWYENNAETAGLGLTGYVGGYTADDFAAYRKKITSKPEVYARNRELFDRLYQEMHRAYDAMSDFMLENLAFQSVSDDIQLREDMNGKMTNPYGDLAVKEEASMLQQNVADKQSACLRRITAIGDALRHYIDGKALSASAQSLLSRLGA